MATKQHKASCRSLTALSSSLSLSLSLSFSLFLCVCLYKIDGNFPRIGETIGEKNRGNKPRFHRIASRRPYKWPLRFHLGKWIFAPFTTEPERTIQCKKKWLGPLRHKDISRLLNPPDANFTPTLAVCYQVIGMSWL